MTSEKRIRDIASGLFSLMKKETPAFFDAGGWKGRLIEWSMEDASFKVRLLRFLDVLPTLRTDALVLRLFREYLGSVENPASFFQRGFEVLSRVSPPRAAAPVIRAAVKSLARQFIAGTDPKDALSALMNLRREGAGISIDLLGEAVVSDGEAREYAKRYLELLDFLPPRFATSDSTGSHRDRLDVSLKITALYAQIDPLNREGSLSRISEALRPIMAKAHERNASVTFDMEQYYYKDLFLDTFHKVLDEFPDNLLPGIALQAYLRDTKEDVTRLVSRARETKRRIAVRLVKGAYWDYETVINRQQGWPVPVFLQKGETDRNFEELTRFLLENAAYVYPCIATHNVRSVGIALALAEELRLPADSFEFQMLYGMGDPLRRAMARSSVQYPVRIYCPVGELIPGMAYLVRRVLENTANESFFRQTFAEKRSFEELIRPPEPADDVSGKTSAEFRNETATDFSKPHARRAMGDALTSVRDELGKRHPLRIGSQDVFTETETRSINPARPDEVIGRISSAARTEADRAIEAAKKAYPDWSRTPVETRASYLFKAADEVRKRKFPLIALEVYETGKTVREADGDVAEAVDYLEYYGRQMVNLGAPRRLGGYPGERNDYVYEPKGIGVVISPWNFPLAIPTGMTSAAIVAGNCVILKPSGLAPVVARQLMDIFTAVGLPPGVLQYLPGPGSEVGEYLVAHPAVDIIAFTGSKDVGLKIVKLAADVRPGQRNVKRVVAEMGGKNAIIVDETADLDEAVKGVLESALGYQGQKCSACSRVIVVGEAYQEFSGRLRAAMQSIVIGPPEDAATFMGPLIDAAAVQKVRGYIEQGKAEGRPLLIREEGREGFFVGPAFFEVGPDAVIARDEIFGPVLSLIRAEGIDDAVAIANRSEYALTAGIFSRSPANIDKARNGLRAGNLYINRKITGALVGRQPFGGFGMSGIGSKAGGPDYLVQFLNPKAISENTMRKGFVPPSGM